MELLYIILIIIGFLMFLGITIIGCASTMYKNILKNNLSKTSSIGKTAGELTNTSLKEKELDVQVIRTPSDNVAHFDYQNKVVAISDNVYSSFSAVAQGIAVHEVGHAIQDASDSKKFKAFKSLNMFCKIIEPLFWISFIVGLVLILAIDYEPLYGFIAFGVCAAIFIIETLFKIITFQMEKEASSFGKQILKENEINEEDFKTVCSLYKIALTTYFASLFKPVVDLFNFITWLIFNTVGRLFR